MARHGRSFPIPPLIIPFDVYPDPVPPVGQPTMKRTQGVPTQPGYRDRIGRWNALAFGLFTAYLALRLLLE